MEEKTYRLGHHLVAFLDVLGQREAFRRLRLPKTPEEHISVQEVMRSTVGFVSNLRTLFLKELDAFEAGMSNPIVTGGKTLRPDFFAFSDSFITSVALKDDDEFLKPPVLIFATLSSASLLMASSLASKHALRGGIDVGLGTEMGTGEIYGTALERAYLLESRQAEYPRIMIGDEFWRYLSSCIEAFENVNNQRAKAMIGIIQKAMELTTEDTDGKRILDYLGPGIVNLAAPDHANNMVKPAYQFVIDQHAYWLSRGDAKLAGRYAILRQYFESRLPLWGLPASRQ